MAAIGTMLTKYLCISKHKTCKLKKTTTLKPAKFKKKNPTLFKLPIDLYDLQYKKKKAEWPFILPQDMNDCRELELKIDKIIFSIC